MLLGPEIASVRSSPGSAAAGGALASCTAPPIAAIMINTAAVRGAVLLMIAMISTL